MIDRLSHDDDYVAQVRWLTDKVNELVDALNGSGIGASREERVVEMDKRFIEIVGASSKCRCKAPRLRRRAYERSAVCVDCEKKHDHQKNGPTPMSRDLAEVIKRGR